MTYQVDKDGTISAPEPDPIWDAKKGVVEATWISIPGSEGLKVALKARNALAKKLRVDGWEIINVGPCLQGLSGPTKGYYLSAWKSEAAYERYRERAGR